MAVAVAAATSTKQSIKGDRIRFNDCGGIHPRQRFVRQRVSQGLEHFRTDVRVGIKIIKDLTGWITGFAVPKFVIDSPHGGGKVPFNPDYLISLDDKKAVFRNYEGKTYEYPQPAYLTKK